MTWADLLWFPPLMLAISLVLGAAGAEDAKPGDMLLSVRRTCVMLPFSVLVVGGLIHVVALLCSG